MALGPFISLNVYLSLSLCQAAVIRQDSFLELYMQEDSNHATSAHTISGDTPLEGSGPVGTQEDLVQLQRKYNLLQEEVIRLRANQDKHNRAQNDLLTSKETVDQLDRVQEGGETATSPRADSPRGKSSISDQMKEN